MSKSNTAQDVATLRAALADVPSNAFDGHTEFERLSPTERLRWCSNAASFWWECNKNNRKLPRVREIHAMCRDARASAKILAKTPITRQIKTRRKGTAKV